MQTVKNFISNILSLGVALGSGLIIPAVVVRYMDTSAFGIIQITLSVTMYISIFVHSINEVLVKDLAKNLQAKNVNAVNKIVSTTFYLLVAVCFVLVILGGLFSFNVTSIFDIPEKYEDGATYLFLGNIISFLMIILTNFFMSPAYARNRLDFCQIAIIGRNTLRFIFLFSSVLIFANFESIGISFVFSSGFILVGSIIYFYKSMDYVSIGGGNYDVGYSKHLMKYSAWIVLNQVGLAVFSYFDIILLNVTIGSEAAGEYALMLQWRILIYTLLGTIIQLFYPKFLQLYSSNSYEQLKKFFINGIKGILMIGAILTGIICISSDVILQYWVGDKYTYLATLMVVVVSHWFVFSAFVLFTSYFLIHDKIRYIAIANFVAAIFYCIVTYLLMSIFDLGLWGMAIASLLVLTIRNFIVFPILGYKKLNIDPKEFYKAILGGISPFILILLLGFGIRFFWKTVGLYEQIFYISLVVVFTITFSWFWVIRKGERELVKEFIYKLTK